MFLQEAHSSIFNTKSKPVIRKNLKVYRRFLQIFLLILLLAFLLDALTGFLIRRLFEKQTSGTLYETTFALDNANSDIVILGSSRAKFHFVPDVFEKELKMSCYNCGRNGSSILYHYAVFKSIVSRYKPKMIILETGPDDLVYSKEDYDGLKVLFPYYSYHPEIRKVIELQGKYTKLKLCSSLFRYNPRILEIVLNSQDWYKKRYLNKRVYKGYTPIFTRMKVKNLLPEWGVGNPVDLEKVKFIESMIQYCKSYHINFFLVGSPMFIKSGKSPASGVLSRMVKQYGIEYWDYSNDAAFVDDPACFADPIHMNNRGAMKLSQLITNRIKDKIMK